MKLLAMQLGSISTLLISLSTLNQPLTVHAQSRFSPENFSAKAGKLAGSFYCRNETFERSVERGLMQASVQSGIAMSELEREVDFNSDEFSQEMVVAIVDYCIDKCPQRAKQIFRDFINLP